MTRYIGMCVSFVFMVVVLAGWCRADMPLMVIGLMVLPSGLALACVKEEE